MLTPVVSVTVTTLLSYGTLRFRHSVELVLVVLAAVGLDALWRRREATAAPPGTAPNVRRWPPEGRNPGTFDRLSG